MKSAGLKWLHAQLNLSFTGFVHYASKLLFWRNPRGLSQFVANYVQEGLPRFSPAHREIAHEPGRCTTCGMCDVACPLLRPSKRPKDFMGPMRLVVSGMSGGPTLADVKPTMHIFADASCQDCRRCETACPENIPIMNLAKHYMEQLAEVENNPGLC